MGKLMVFRLGICPIPLKLITSFSIIIYQSTTYPKTIFVQLFIVNKRSLKDKNKRL